MVISDVTLLKRQRIISYLSVGLHTERGNKKMIVNDELCNIS